jgi:hypothetical protein
MRSRAQDVCTLPPFAFAAVELGFFAAFGTFGRRAFALISSDQRLLAKCRSAFAARAPAVRACAPFRRCSNARPYVCGAAFAQLLRAEPAVGTHPVSFLSI